MSRAGAAAVPGRQPGRQHHVGFRERRRHVQRGDDRRGLRDPRPVRVRGPGGREARVLVPVGAAVRQEPQPRVRRGAAAAGAGAGQRHARLRGLHEEPVRDGQRADHQPERGGPEPGPETGGPQAAATRPVAGDAAVTAAPSRTGDRRLAYGRRAPAPTEKSVKTTRVRQNVRRENKTCTFRAREIKIKLLNTE